MYTVTVLDTQGYLNVLREEISRGYYFVKAEKTGGVIVITFSYEKPGTSAFEAAIGKVA